MSQVQRDVARVVGDALRRRGWRVAVAESCTGGLLAARLTDVPGSSEYVEGGVIAYGDGVKTGTLGVDPDTLARYGAVSRETVREMAAGVAHRLGVPVAVSVTGIAGPAGGTPEKPVGTVWVGVRSPEGVREDRLHFGGERAQVRDQACERALEILLEHVEERAAGSRTTENPDDPSG